MTTKIFKNACLNIWFEFICEVEARNGEVRKENEWLNASEERCEALYRLYKADNDGYRVVCEGVSLKELLFVTTNLLELKENVPVEIGEKMKERLLGCVTPDELWSGTQYFFVPFFKNWMEFVWEQLPR